MNDITHREHIEILVNTFYKTAKSDSVIGPIFTQTVEVDWEKHLPIMYDFWEGVAFGKTNYNRNPMQAHIQLSKLTEMGPKQFESWISIWTKTVDKLFEGEKAEEIKNRAKHIAQLMLHKIEQSQAE